MDRLQFTYAGRDHDRTRALRDGTVRPDSIDLRFVDLRVSEIFWRMARYADFDVAEMSLSTFILTREKKTVDLVAIPIFPSRAFRHDMIFVNTKAGIERPEDLKGKRVGLPEYQMTAALWIRGLLQHEHGVASQDIHWVRGPHFAGHPAEERVPWIPPGDRSRLGAGRAGDRRSAGARGDRRADIGGGSSGVQTQDGGDSATLSGGTGGGGRLLAPDQDLPDHAHGCDPTRRLRGESLGSAKSLQSVLPGETARIYGNTRGDSQSLAAVLAR